MKILELGKFYPIRGGVEKVEYDLMTGLSERGIDCDMLCAGHEGHKGDVQVNAHGRVLVCDTLLKAAATMISPNMILRLRKICSEYDIIHVHHPDPMAALALFLSGYKGRVIVHWHSDIVRQQLALKLFMPLQNWLLKRAEKVVGTTPIYLKESPHLQQVQDKTVCLPIGIDPIEQVPAEKVATLQQQYGNKKIVFSLGRLVPYKGFRYLIEAAQYLNEDTVVLIGGKGPLMEELSALIEQLGVQNKVKLLGRVSDEDLPVYYAACSLFCMSSVQKSEAFGIVNIEAMSCGKPLVATRIPASGVSWVNEHGVSGLNAEPEDAQDLAKAINAVLSDEEQYRKFAEGAKKRFETVFTRKKMIDDMIKTYEDKK